MASIPQDQITNAYYYVLRNPKMWYGFGRGYSMWYDGNHTYKLVHYGTTIYEANSSTKKAKVGGWSISDVMAINSLAYYLGTKGAYLTGGTVYLEGTGPRYAPKKSKQKKASPFGL
jgi:hypothetical protein